MEGYSKIIDFIKDIIEYRKNKNEKRYDEYVETIFKEAKLIYEDLIKILFYVKQEFLNGELSVQNAIKYIEMSRVPFKATRRELHSKLIVAIFNTKEEEDMFMFAVGIRGVMQGGMAGEYADNVSLIINNYYNRYDIEDGLLLYQGKHTLADLVDYFVNNNPDSIYYEKRTDIYGGEEEYINKKFIDVIGQQIKSIEEYWKLTTIAYEKIKYDSLI